MSETTEKIGSSRGAAVIGMLVTFFGGYVLGSMGRPRTARAQRWLSSSARPYRWGRARSSAPPRRSSPSWSSRTSSVPTAPGPCRCRNVWPPTTGRVRWVFKHLPSAFTRTRVRAAASLAAHAQGQFWAYHDRLFSIRTS